MKGINVNSRRDYVSARYGQFSSTKSSFGAGGSRSSKSSSIRRSSNNSPGRHENNDFMSKLKRDSTPGNVYIPSNGAESIDINNYLENLLM
jgi:hypothetical protein